MRKRRKRKNTVKACLLAVLIALQTVSGAVTVRAEAGQVQAKAAVVMDADSGRVLFEQRPDERLPMASTTKIMTALITLEQPGLDESFTADESALRVEGSSMGLRAGDTVTLRALAAGMLAASGNDAANAAAVRIAGNIPDFVGMMNRRAEKLGLDGTHFANPSGLDGEEHYSTARDLAVLAREALKNPDFAEMCSQPKIEAKFGAPPYLRTLKNHNKLLEMYDGAVGVKTGFTKKSGRCLVSAAERNGITLICVTLGCPDDWNVHMALYDRYFASLCECELTELLPEIYLPVTGSVIDRVRLCAGESVCAALTAEEYSRVTARVYAEKFLFAPARQGDAAGYAVFLLDGEELGRVGLNAAETAPAATGKKSGLSVALGRILRRLIEDR